MRVDIQQEGDCVVATVHGRVDTVSATDFQAAFADTLTGGEKLLVFDLEHLEYISSAGLRVILAIAKNLKNSGGEVRLAATSGAVKKVFQIAGFFSLLKHFETRSEALEAT